jgi:hypothetical protein
MIVPTNLALTTGPTDGDFQNDTAFSGRAFSAAAPCTIDERNPQGGVSCTAGTAAVPW